MKATLGGPPVGQRSYPLYDLTQAVAAACTLEEIYDAALKCLRDCLGVEKSSVLLFDDDQVMRFKTWLNLSPEYRAAVEGHSPWTPDTPAPQPVLVPDIHADEGLAALRDVIAEEGIRALAFIPLCAAGKLLGKFMLYYPQPHSFTEQEIMEAQTIGAQVAFAIDQYRSREERELSSGLLSGQKTALEMVVAGAPLPDVLRSLALLVERLAGSRSTVSILILDGEGRLRNGASPGLSPRYLEAIDGLTPDASIGTCSAAAERKETVVTGDISTAAEWASLRDLAAAEGVRAAWSQPMFARDGSVLGTFGTYFRDRREPTARERQLVEVLSRTAAIAIERDRTQEERRATDQRYRTLVESLGLAVYTTDANGIITLYNDAAVTLWGRQPVLGEEFWCGSWRLFWPDGSEMELKDCPMGMALREDRPIRDVEIIAERPDGTKAIILPHPTPLHDISGKLTGAVNVLVDITELKRTQEALRDAIRGKDDFLGLVSHELRNPVTRLSGNAEILLNRWRELPFETQEECLAEINVQALRLERLVDNMMVLSRFERGILPPTEPHLLQRLLHETISEFRRRFPDTAVNVIIEDGLPPVETSASTVDQVLWNLLTNAHKYGPSKGPIHVELRSGPDHLELVVQDEGPGVPEEDLNRLFEPYFRSSATPGEAAGLGLGLSVCKRLVEAQQGEMWARRRDVRGLEFGVRLRTLATVEA